MRASAQRSQALLHPQLGVALPHDVMSRLDLSTLRLEPRTYIDKDHREYFVDLSALVELNDKPARVYMLFEHKSWSDTGTLLQLLRCADELSLVGSLRPTAAGPVGPPLSAFGTRFKSGHESVAMKKAEQLTPVIPVVVYHGKEDAPRMLFRDLFDLTGDYESKLLSKYIPAFEAALVDVSHMPEWQLDNMSLALSAGLWSFRVAHDTVDEFLKVLNRLGKRWGKTLLQDPGFELLLTYMLQGSGLSPDEFEEKVNRAIEDSLVGEAVVTTYDQLIEKGREQASYVGGREAPVERNVCRGSRGTQPLMATGSRK